MPTIQTKVPPSAQLTEEVYTDFYIHDTSSISKSNNSFSSFGNLNQNFSLDIDEFNIIGSIHADFELDKLDTTIFYHDGTQEYHGISRLADIRCYYNGDVIYQWFASAINGMIVLYGEDGFPSDSYSYERPGVLNATFIIPNTQTNGGNQDIEIRWRLNPGNPSGGVIRSYNREMSLFILKR